MAMPFHACANFSGTLNVTGTVASAKMVLNFNNNTSLGGGTFDGQLQGAIVNLYTGVGGVSLVGSTVQRGQHRAVWRA